MSCGNRYRRSRSGNDWFTRCKRLQHLILDALSNAERGNNGGAACQIYVYVGNGSRHDYTGLASELAYSAGGISAGDNEIQFRMTRAYSRKYVPHEILDRVDIRQIVHRADKKYIRLQSLDFCW